MSKTRTVRERIIDQPSYWVEQINGELYDSIMNYMEEHDMKQKDLAKYLGISKGRMSQIINDGEINFRIQKIIQIALKLDKIPSFKFQDKNEFLSNEIENEQKGLFVIPFDSEQNWDLDCNKNSNFRSSKVIGFSKYCKTQQEVSPDDNYVAEPEELYC